MADAYPHRACPFEYGHWRCVYQRHNYTGICHYRRRNAANPVLEERARNLSKQLRCLVCQNQSIDDSDADLARDLRREVRSQIAAGTSDDAIIDQLRAKYGDYVLLNPPLDQATLFLWLSPLGFILLGGLIVMMARRQRGAAIATELDAAERARIEKMLASRDSENRPKT